MITFTKKYQVWRDPNKSTYGRLSTNYELIIETDELSEALSRMEGLDFLTMSVQLVVSKEA